MKKKSIFIIVIAALLVLAGAGYWFTSKKDTNNKQETVKIGIIVPLTGDVATYGQDLKKGMDIAFTENPDFTPCYQDSKASQSVGLNAMKYLRNVEKIDFFIGDATTTVSLSIAEDVQKNGDFLLVPIASGDDIKNKGDMVFMNCPINKKQAIAAARYVASNYPGKRIGTMFQQIPYGIELSESFNEELDRQRIEVVFNESIQDIKTGLKSAINKAKNAKLDIIFIPMEYEAAALVLKQCNEQDVHANFIGTDGSYSQKLIELAGDAAEGYCFTMFPIDPNSNYYIDFCKKFEARYGNQPNIFSCYGYESAMNMISAIKATGSDPIKVRDFFLNHSFDSFTGQLEFDSTGEVVRDFGIVKVVNKTFNYDGNN